MSAAIKRIPRDQRLRITAKFAHETLRFEGDVFQFLEHLMANRLTGKGTFTVNQGSVFGMEFDLRQMVLQDADTLPVKNVLDTGKESP